MNRFQRWSRWRAGAAAAALLALGCSDQSVTVQLRPLQSSGDVTYVCRNAEGEGVPLDACHPASIRRDHDLLALVTQTSTGEVAVINVPLDPDDPRPGEGVVDVDKSTPGFGFLHIGDRPVDIVSTPEGRASFAAVAETGKPGLFALPTTCLGPPVGGKDEKKDENAEPARDLTTWPACRLPAAPGRLAVVVDAASSCAAPERQPPVEGDAACHVELLDGLPPTEARKLLVTLPDAGSIAVVDAQWLLDRAPGTFEDCRIETTYTLSADLPATIPEQRLPPDLDQCAVAGPPTPPPPTAFLARPSDLAVADGVVYVSDSLAPVVHVLDVSQPCAAVELPPLLPRAFDEPERVVTTSGVSVSPLTPSGRRFLYAIDADPSGSSLMVFDVSPGSTDRTPILRPGSALLPFEPPDRLEFGGAVKDVTFFVRDRPEFDLTTGTAVVGQSCDPDPSSSGLGIRYRSDTGEYSRGARAAELRGVFAAVLLSNGVVSFVDVEDFDAPCRRPASGNPGPEEDFRGCAADPITDYRTSDGRRTVTDEVSCRMVQPHRTRSAALGITSPELGIGAPTLSAFPQLRVPERSAQLTVEQRPKLLGVPFPRPGDPAATSVASVFVGTTEYRARTSASDLPPAELVIDPSLARQYSVTLPFNEPRAYPPTQPLSLTYEGRIIDTLPSGFLEPLDAETLTLSDASAGYCSSGVSDVALMRELGGERFSLAGEALESFARNHSDYVVITADFPEDDDSYWEANASCSRDLCEQTFGEHDELEGLSPNRDFTILDGAQQRLVIQPREQLPERRETLSSLAVCCFPSGLSYEVRASRQWVLRDPGFRHDIAADPVTLDCVRDCNAQRRLFQSRIFEITASSCAPAAPGAPESCGVGQAGPGDVCAIDARLGGVRLDEAAARCIHQTPTSRFALYRGTEPSVRDMVFNWEVIGGFRPLSIEFGRLSGNVLPESIVGLRDFDWLTVVDASSLGLSVVDLEDLTLLTPTLN